MPYDDLNTSGGQSGSPVLMFKSGYYLIIGIHVGYDESEKYNLAIVTTAELEDWIGARL